MTARKPESGKKPKVERPELHTDTIQELTESEAEAVAGGERTLSGTVPFCTYYGGRTLAVASPEGKGRPRARRV
jgi:hypothetical protein